MRLFGIALSIAIALAVPANALSLPSNGQLDFDVVRNGKDIGDHSYSFSGQNNAFTVRVVTDITVKVPVIRVTAYSFAHQSVETWEGGTFQQLISATRDDGEPYQLTTASRGALPASLWNEDIVRSATLMNTIDGEIMSIRVADLGIEVVNTQRGDVSAHHYRLSGELARDVWYDGDGNLAQVMFRADDGSTVMYIRK